MREYQFQIFSPGGNDTALVFGLDFDRQTRRKIDYEIRSNYKIVEQVGFVEKKNGKCYLEMAGGEFCGNATRSAANYFLRNTIGEIDIYVSGVSCPLRSGVKEINTAWASMPTGKSLDVVSLCDEGFFLVPLEGIFHLVIPSDKSKPFLSMARMADSFYDELKVSAKGLMDRYSLTSNPACGVMFLEETLLGLQMHPCVLVTGVESSMYYETACGSGSIAAVLTLAFLCKSSTKIKVIQPSRYAIIAAVEVENKNTIVNAYIDGEVMTNGRILTRRLEL